jgi:hypothetical protein
MLPRQDQICRDPESTKIEDYDKTRLLRDDTMFLAFYPRRNVHRGILFACIALSDDQLNALIVVDPKIPGRFILREDIRSSWAALEDPLFQVASRLLSKHRYAKEMHPQTFPKAPHQFGYKVSHSTRALAFSCAKRARAAFTMLSALVSFAVALWLTNYEDDCFDEAFMMLTNAREDPLPYVWLKYLQDSIVCDFTPGLRPGGFVDPYRTRWGSGLLLFCRASVPMWLLWGKEDPTLSPSLLYDRSLLFLFPPVEFIDIAKTREATFSNQPLPEEGTYRYSFNSSKPTPPGHFPPTIALHTPLGKEILDRHSLRPSDESHSLPTPPPPRAGSQPANAGTRPPPNVDGYSAFSAGGNYTDLAPAEDRSKILEAGSRQRPGESWGEFFERMKQLGEERKKKETDKDRQRRESREAHAKKSGYSQKSTVFRWEQDDQLPTFFRRTRVSKAEAEFEWNDHTEHQRHFWPHLNEWDLCPQLPRYPGQERGPYSEDEDDDDGYMGSDYAEQSGEVQDKAVGGIALMTVQQVAQRIDGVEGDGCGIQLMSLEEYLKVMHGYHARLEESWDVKLHSTSKDVLSQSNGEVRAIKRLLYGPTTTTLPRWMLTSIINFYNIAINDGGNAIRTYADLPAAWDISRHLRTSPELVCDLSCVRVQRVIMFGNGSTLYILRPSRGSSDTSPWFIATPSATVVLLVYRKGWTTMVEIGRGLLEMGIPFRTVVERICSEPRAERKLTKNTSSLGVKPYRFEGLQAEDFAHYEECCRKVLESSSGRAIRLRGGIVGRIASEVVPDLDVLDGPTFCDELVGHHGELEFRDDRVVEMELDIVCGVYSVNATAGGSVKTHSSLWPKQSTWEKCGLAGDHWSPASEEFYKSRRAAFSSGSFELKGAGKWKIDLRFD